MPCNSMRRYTCRDRAAHWTIRRRKSPWTSQSIRSLLDYCRIMGDGRGVARLLEGADRPTDRPPGQPRCPPAKWQHGTTRLCRHTLRMRGEARAWTDVSIAEHTILRWKLPASMCSIRHPFCGEGSVCVVRGPQKRTLAARMKLRRGAPAESQQAPSPASKIIAPPILARISRMRLRARQTEKYPQGKKKAYIYGARDKADYQGSATAFWC